MMTPANQKLSPIEFKKLQGVFDQAVELPHTERAELISKLREKHPGLGLNQAFV